MHAERGACKSAAGLTPRLQIPKPIFGLDIICFSGTTEEADRRSACCHKPKVATDTATIASSIDSINRLCLSPKRPGRKRLRGAGGYPRYILARYSDVWLPIVESF